MEPKETKKVFEQLRIILKAIATGNVAIQVERPLPGGKNHELIDLGIMGLERLRAIFNYYGVIKPEKLYIFQAELAFILDEHFKIESYTREAVELLGCRDKDFIGVPFLNILESSFRSKWEKLTRLILSRDRYSLNLPFSRKDGALVETHCYVSKQVDKGYVITTFVPVLYTEVYQEFFEDPPGKRKRGRKATLHVLQRPSDLATVFELQEYIEANLTTNLPPKTELAQHFLKNPAELTSDFREVFGQSPYQYHKDQRIRLAADLITKGSRLDQVAYSIGYQSYPNFSLAFKQVLGITPREFQKGLPDEKSDE